MLHGHSRRIVRLSDTVVGLGGQDCQAVSARLNVDVGENSKITRCCRRDGISSIIHESIQDLSEVIILG